MTREKFKDKASRFVESFRAFLDKYEEANPEWMTVTLLQIVYKAILQLKGLIEIGHIHIALTKRKPPLTSGMNFVINQTYLGGEEKITAVQNNLKS